MPRKHVPSTGAQVSAQPRLHQRASAIQEYGTVNLVLPLELEHPVRLEITKTAEPIASGYDDTARSLQEGPLASERADLLSTPPLVR